MNEIKGYKVFNPDWTCRGFQYEVGKVFEEDVEPKCGSRGFHFCEKAVDCFNYYSFNPNNKVAEVVALGDVATEGNLSCTNKIQIAREIPWEELLTIVNVGKYCTGFGNTGYRNTGDWNTGNWNTGYRNTGNWNTGNWNTGNWNTGDWNTTNYSSGCFNTVESTIMLFDKPSDMTMAEWLSSNAYNVMDECPHNGNIWVSNEYMTDKEKEEHPEHETTGGYLKVIKVSDTDKQEWWDSLESNERECVKALPNFDADIFYECTGIKVGD